MCDDVVVVVECFLQSDVELGHVHVGVREVQLKDGDVDESEEVRCNELNECHCVVCIAFVSVSV